MKPLSENPGLPELQTYLREMVVERGFANQSIHEQFMKFLEECGELAKATKHLLKHPEDQKLRMEAAHETADVLIYLLHIANMLNIDVMTAFREKEAINQKRTW